MYTKGDFHIHSTFSDGKYTPTEIVSLSQKRNVDIIAITDHNNTLGIEEAVKAGNELGVRVIPGVELSTKHNSSRVHILGYFKDDSFKNELLIEILKNVKNHNISNIKTLLGKKINFQNSKNRLSVENGIKILRLFGAVVILAHPVLLEREVFKNIIEMNFDGLEAKYFSNREEDTEYFLKIAEDRNLLYTAGSDFHSCKEFYRIHGIIGDVYLDQREIYNFLIGGGLPYL